VLVSKTDGNADCLGVLMVYSDRNRDDERRREAKRQADEKKRIEQRRQEAKRQADEKRRTEQRQKSEKPKPSTPLSQQLPPPVGDSAPIPKTPAIEEPATRTVSAESVPRQIQTVEELYQFIF
jgi:cell division protein FtsN